jgi:hypothetical protein
MPRCADHVCGRSRPDLSSFEWLAPRAARRWRALQFNQRWYCSRACVEQAALRGLVQSAAITPATMPLRPLKLGVLLRHAGAISQRELETALHAMGVSGLRIGRQLLELGYASPEAVLRGLATQAGVSYFSTFDVGRVRRSPVALPRGMVQALGLVPFECDGQAKQVHVVCAAPVPRAAMRAMARLIGWTPLAYLVHDEVFEDAMAAYEPADDDLVAHDAATVPTIGAAAARVADNALEDGAVTMRHTAYDDRVWVRVEGAQRVSDLIVNIDREAPCQAELTAH